MLTLLKSNVYLAALVFVFTLSSCDSDEEELRNAFKGKEFGVYFTSPVDGQGFSTKETIEIKAFVTFVTFPHQPENASLLNHLQIKFYSDKDGLLQGELVNKDGSVTFRPTTLSSNVHMITIKAVDPNQVEKSASIQINTFAPGTITLTVSKDPRENAIVKWSVPSPELVDIIELYRTQYNYSSGGGYSLEPWDTIRFKPDVSQSYYDNQLPFSDKVSYSMRVFAKAGYWSKSERDTTIDGAKRFKLQLSNGHDWNVYGVDAISSGTEKIIHIRNGTNVTAFDFEKMSVVRERTGNFPINHFHLGDYGNGSELYIARDQTLEVYNAADYVKKTEINVNYKIEGIQGHSNQLFLSMANHVNRTTLSKTNNPVPGFFRFKLLDDGSSLIAISYSGTPTDMKYIDFSNNVNNPAIIDDKYHGSYPLNPALFAVIPKQNHVITSWFGSVYTADEKMEFVGSLNDVASEYFTSFAFNESGTVIYAGSRDEKKISIYSFPQMTRLGEIKTKGRPAFLFFKGTYLVSVSSTKPLDMLVGPSEIGFEIFDL